MKKLFFYIIAGAFVMSCLTACEDVPMPFNNPLDYINGEEKGSEIVTIGTVDNPQTVTQAINVVNSLENGGTTDEYYIIEGKIKQIKTNAENIAQYKNIDYIITDGTSEITVFRGKNLDNTDFTEPGQINVGDVVVVIGRLTKYENANTGQIVPEVAQGNYIIKYTKGEAPAAVGSIDNPQTVTQAVAVINALADGATTEADYYVAGKISRILTTDDNIAKFKNIDYYISDGTNEIQVFRGKNLDNTDFTAAGQINVGDEVIVLGKLMKYINPNTSAVVPEMAQGNYIVKYTKGTTSSTGTPKGSGTMADPYNAAGANKFIKSLAADTESDKDVYIKGIIVKFANNGEFENSGTYGNSSFYISDDGKESSEQFYVFRTLYFGNVKWTSGITPKVGDEVVICGKVVYYQGKTPETLGSKSYLYSLNGKTEGGGGGSDTPSSNLGTKDAPLTVAKALDAINALEDSGETETEAFVKGKISKVQSFNDKYKSITYYISDDGTETKELQIYSGKNIGGAEFASIDDLSVGDVVVVKGKLKKFMKNGEAIPEMNQPNEIISITKGSGGGDNGGGEQGELGSYTKPYSVASGIAAQGAEFKNIKDIYVKGYIVGWIEGQKLEEGAHFNANATVKSNILIADTANETDLSKCMPVQLPNNDVRSGMNLQDHPEFYGKAVILYGELAKYFGAAGVKSVTYAESDGKTLGTKP